MGDFLTFLPLLVVIGIAVIVVIATRRRTRTTGELRGIMGWLVLPAIGVVLNPLRTLGQLKDYFPALKLVQEGSVIYWILIIETVFIISYVCFGIFVAIRFFGKRRNAPALFISLLIIAVVFTFADSLALLILFDVPFFEPTTTGPMIATVLVCFIWIPYMLRSQRVKNTFVY